MFALGRRARAGVGWIIGDGVWWLAHCADQVIGISAMFVFRTVSVGIFEGGNGSPMFGPGLGEGEDFPPIPGFDWEFGGGCVGFLSGAPFPHVLEFT